MIAMFSTVIGIFIALFYLFKSLYQDKVYTEMSVQIESDTYELIKERYIEKAIDETYIDANIGIVSCLAKIVIINKMLSNENHKKGVKHKILKNELQDYRDILSKTTTSLVEKELSIV